MATVVKVTLQKVKDKATVRLESPDGQVDSGSFDLKWTDPLSWQAIFCSLELHVQDKRSWPSEQAVLDKAEELGLFVNGRPANDRLEVIGKKLYNMVFRAETDDLHASLRSYMYQPDEGAVLVEFHIPDEGSLLQAYPWELLHDGDRFLFIQGGVYPVRRVDCNQKMRTFEPEEALRVLLVDPQPRGLPAELSDLARSDLAWSDRRHLRELSDQYPGRFAFQSLDAALPITTLAKLLAYFRKPGYVTSIVHVDTHGEYGWLCQCKRVNLPGVETCECGKTRARDQKDQGYLAFEDKEGSLNWIDGEQLAGRLGHQDVRAVVLSACKSGTVGGASTFNSIAGALVRNGIPAVVAMQFSVSVPATKILVQTLYGSLVSGASLTEALGQVRRDLFPEHRDDWYRPVLYLRTDSDNPWGRVFVRLSEDKLRGRRKNLVPPEPRDNLVRQMWRWLWDFWQDPFLHTDGGRDPYLAQYFHRVPRFSDILGKPEQPEAVLVFGDEGSGKSSLRNAIAQYCREDGAWSVAYLDLKPFASDIDREQAVRKHVDQMLRVAIRDLDRDVKQGAVYVQEDVPDIDVLRSTLLLYIDRYGSRLVKRRLTRVLSLNQETTDPLSTDPRDLLGEFCQCVNALFGFKCTYFLVDPDRDISPDFDAAWRTLEPLVSEYRLTELPEYGAALKFFLNAKFLDCVLQIDWIDREQIRRVYPHSLKWSDDTLHGLLRTRLTLCSRGRVRSLGQMSELEDLDDLVIQEANSKPRLLISICNAIFSVHCEVSDGEPQLKITKEEVKKALGQLPTRYDPVSKLIAGGEGPRVEFKSTLRYCLESLKKEDWVEKAVAKTLCAFINSDGGTLVIGVDDNGNALGLANDFSVVHNGNRDGFERAFNDIVLGSLGAVYRDHMHLTFQDYNGKQICVIEVEQSPVPVYCGKSREFYIRLGPATKLLNSEETVAYIQRHFR